MSAQSDDRLYRLRPVAGFRPLRCCSSLLGRSIYSPGPVLFTQERDGYRGRKFRMLKFRTMYLDADARLANCLAASPGNGAGVGAVFQASP